MNIPENEWLETSKFESPHDEIVMTKIHDSKGERNNGFLKRRGKLWWTTDDGMYVYYTPTHFKRYSESKRNQITALYDELKGNQRKVAEMDTKLTELLKS